MPLKFIITGAIGAALALAAAPAAAGEPIPGITLSLELNRTAGERPVGDEPEMGDPVPGGTISLEASSRAGEPVDSANLQSNIADALAPANVRASEAEMAFVARRTAELARTRPGETAPRSVRYCFPTWCSTVRLSEAPAARPEAARRR